MKRRIACLCILLSLLGAGKARAAETTINGIRVLQFGSVYCTIRENGENKRVPTAELTFGENVPDGEKLAVLNAPRLGEAKMRKGPSEKTAMFYTCKGGWVCAVLKTGKEYTKIHYQGVEGYVKTKSLRFFPAADVEKSPLGLLSYQGRTTGKRTINLRCLPDKKSVSVASWPVGTQVYLLSHENGWWEVEARGIRGFVQEEYVTPPAPIEENKAD